MENLELLIQAAISVTVPLPTPQDSQQSQKVGADTSAEDIGNDPDGGRSHKRVENSALDDISNLSHKKSRQNHGDDQLPITTAIFPFQSLSSSYSETKEKLELNSIAIPLSLHVKKEIFTKIMDNFNLNDIRKFQAVLQRFAKDSVIISSKTLRCESIGFSSLLIFWVLILEGYPDAVITNIRSKELSRNSCEFSFNFIGTRITAHPVTMLYSLAVDKLALGATVTSSELLSLVTRSSLDSSFCAPTCPFVSCKGRSILTYDSDGKISRWFFDMKV
jgi:hypothetical protein